METTHGRKSKSNTTFKAVLNKVLVSALILGTVAGMSVPAYAADVGTSVGREAQTIAYNQGISVESAIASLRNTISTIKGMIDSGKVSDSTIQNLCSQLYALESAVKGNATSDVYAVLDEVESVVYSMGRTASSSATTDAYTAIAVVRDSLGTITATNKQAAETNDKTNKTTSFSDLDPQKHAWAYTAIMDMTSRGLFNGTSTPVNGVGTFAPDKQMSRAEFITVMTRYMYPDQKGSGGAYWWSGSYNLAISKGLLSSNDFTDASMSTPMTREEMAMVLSRASSEKGTSASSVISSSNIPDFNKVDGRYSVYVLQVYTEGLIAGVDGAGTFNPKGVLTRAQASTVIYRLIQRVDGSQTGSGETTTPPAKDVNDDGKVTPGTEVRTLYWNDPSRPYARSGDIFVDKSGKEWKLTLDERTGVVGVGVPIATDLGRTQGNQVVKDGGYVTDLSRPELSGNQYLVNPLNNEGHFNSQWSAISREYTPDYKGTKDGELSKDKNFIWSVGLDGWGLVVDQNVYE